MVSGLKFNFLLYLGSQYQFRCTRFKYMTAVSMKMISSAVALVLVIIKVKSLAFPKYQYFLDMILLRRTIARTEKLDICAIPRFVHYATQVLFPDTYLLLYCGPGATVLG